MKHIWTKNQNFLFFILHCSYVVDHYEYKNTLILAFYLSYLKGRFFASSKNRHGTYPLNILKQTTQNSVQEKMENVSSILILQLIFAFPQKFLNSYFQVIFTILVIADIQRISCWGKMIKGILMNQFLHLSIQHCQKWMRICLEKLNALTSIRICKICRINIVNQ